MNKIIENLSELTISQAATWISEEQGTAIRGRPYGSEKFNGAFDALKVAVLNNKIKAVQHFRGGHKSSKPVYFDEAINEIKNEVDDAQFSTIKWRHDFGLIWDNLTFHKSELREWSNKMGLATKGSSESMTPYRDPNSDRFSPELACAIAAWEACPEPKRGKTAKLTLQAWIEENGHTFGLWQQGSAPKGTAERIAIVANWKKKGGVPPSSGGI